jgi:hypothetical protein
MRQRAFLRGLLLISGLVAAGWAGLTTAALATSGNACKPVTIAGKRVCVEVGDKCAVRNRAAYRRVGLDCVAGRVRKAAPRPTTTKPPTTEPATTTAPTITTIGDDFPLAGHYQGVTSQGRPLAFDVKDDRKNLTNIVGGAVVETCNPAHEYTFFGFETGSYDFPVGPDGSWHLNGGARTDNNAGITAGNKIVMSARFSAGGHVEGTYDVVSSVTDAGVSYSCSGSVTWTGSHP